MAGTNIDDFILSLTTARSWTPGPAGSVGVVLIRHASVHHLAVGHRDGAAAAVASLEGPWLVLGHHTNAVDSSKVTEFPKQDLKN